MKTGIRRVLYFADGDYGGLDAADSVATRDDIYRRCRKGSTMFLGIGASAGRTRRDLPMHRSVAMKTENGHIHLDDNHGRAKRPPWDAHATPHLHLRIRSIRSEIHLLHRPPLRARPIQHRHLPGHHLPAPQPQPWERLLRPRPRLRLVLARRLCSRR